VKEIDRNLLVCPVLLKLISRSIDLQDQSPFSKASYQPVEEAKALAKVNQALREEYAQVIIELKTCCDGCTNCVIPSKLQ
jgi:hypothetical protein